MDNDEIVCKVIDSKVVENTYNDALSPGLKELGKVGVDLLRNVASVFSLSRSALESSSCIP